MQVAVDRLETVVAGGAPAGLDLDPARRQVEFVVDHDESARPDRRRRPPDGIVGRVEAGPPHQGRHGLTGLVHERRGDGQQDTAVTDPDLAHLGVESLFGAQTAVVPFGQRRHRFGAGVVPGVDEVDTRVAQTDDQEVGRGAPPRSGRRSPSAEQGLALRGVAVGARTGLGSLAGIAGRLAGGFGRRFGLGLVAGLDPRGLAGHHRGLYVGLQLDAAREW